MRRPSRFATLLLVFAGLATAAMAASHLPAPVGGWRPGGSGAAARATWQSAGGDPAITIDCEQADARIRLRVASSRMAPQTRQLSLAADGVSVDYPAQPARGSDTPAVVARIALDAPILDRMLVARTFTVGVDGRALSTGLPGDALARVVRACRQLHWPRESPSP